MTTTLIAQETINLSNYDGSAISVTVASTVNDDITIVFEDSDIINNFYTENRDNIYLYGGLQIADGGTFQGSPSFGDLGSQPILTLFNDTDNSIGPNTYSITFNLANEYDSVPDGTIVLGFNLLFQNEFGGGGNNQTVDLFVDLADAMKDSTLSITNPIEIETITTIVKDNQLLISRCDTHANIRIYSILGQTIASFNFIRNKDIIIDLTAEPKGIYIVKIITETSQKTTKIILD
jgi:hypothetical protein